MYSSWDSQSKKQVNRWWKQANPPNTSVISQRDWKCAAISCTTASGEQISRTCGCRLNRYLHRFSYEEFSRYPCKCRVNEMVEYYLTHWPMIIDKGWRMFIEKLLGRHGNCQLHIEIFESTTTIWMSKHRRRQKEKLRPKNWKKELKIIAWLAL